MFTVTVNEQVAVLPEASVAVHVTVVVPCGNADPDGGTQVVTTPGQLSLEEGVVKVTTSATVSGSPVAVIGEGQVIVGGCVSFTVTVNVQLGPSPAAVHVTVVVPTGKVEPVAGEQVIVPQSPVEDGAG